MKNKKRPLCKVAGWGIVVFLILVMVACNGTNNDAGNNEGNNGPDGNAVDAPAFQPDYTELDTSDFSGDEVLATYDGGEITGEEFANYLGFMGFLNPFMLDVNDANIRPILLENLILQKTVVERATAEGTEYPADEVDELLNTYEREFGADAIADGYEKLQINEEIVRNFIEAELMVEHYFLNQVNEEEMDALYAENELEYTKVDVRHILISTHERSADMQSLEEVRDESEAREIADDVYAQLQDGADFVEMAIEHSDDEASQVNGGLIEDAELGRLVPEFAQASMDQEIDEIGEPVQTDFGFHIIRVEHRERNDELLQRSFVDQLYNEYHSEQLPELIDEIHLTAEM